MTHAAALPMRAPSRREIDLMDFRLGFFFRNEIEQVRGFRNKKRGWMLVKREWKPSNFEGQNDMKSKFLLVIYIKRCRPYLRKNTTASKSAKPTIGRMVDDESVVKFAKLPNHAI